MTDERRVRILGALCFLLVLVAFHGEIEAQDGIILELESEQYSYVVGEPVKLIATLRNGSANTIRIPECDEFVEDMQYLYFYYRVRKPGRGTQNRMHQDLFIDGIDNPYYTGEPLAPGESREIFMNPNVTTRYEPRTRRQIGADETTFAAPGEYRVRIVYDIGPFWQRLWKVPGGLASNWITLKFRKPTSVEKEILDAYWTGGHNAEVFRVVHFDEDRLRKAIAAHSDDPFVRYAYLDWAGIYMLKVSSRSAETNYLKRYLCSN
jgi:hypothetical protein